MVASNNVAPPLTVDERLTLAIHTLNFFGITDYPQKCAIVGRQVVAGRTTAFAVSDLLTYLSQNGFPQIYKYGWYMGNFCQSLRAAGFLTFAGMDGQVINGERYFTVAFGTKMQRPGHLWLGKALGADFLFSRLAPSVVMIEGISQEGDLNVGSGLVIGPNLILTCAHVIKDMVIHDEQYAGSKKYRVSKAIHHPEIDVGVIFTEDDLDLVPGLVFRDPTVAEPLFNLGYPRITYTQSSSILMQRGEATAVDVRLFRNEEVFLYSAISRPGNSGGPLVSENGYILGIVTQDLVSKAQSQNHQLQNTDFSSMPYYAGIPASVIKKALATIAPDFVLPVESYET